MNTSGAQVSRIEKFDVFIVTAIFFCVALVSIGARLAIKLQRRPFHLDDAFLVLAAILLIPGSALLYAQLDSFYGNIQPSLRGKWSAIQILLWASTTCIKLGFLMLFVPIINIAKGFKKYFVTAIVFAILAGAYMTMATIVVHPDFSPSVDSSHNGSDLKYLAITYGGTALDVFSYLLIIYLLVIVGGDPDIVMDQKLAARAFLCVTAIIVGFSVVKNIGFGSATALSEDGVWQIFWTHLEATVSLAIVSITTLQPMFFSNNNATKADYEKSNENYDAERGLPKNPSATSVREGDEGWWKSSGENEKDSAVNVSMGSHSRGSSQSSVLKNKISGPRFVGGTSDWVVTDSSSSTYSREEGS